MAFTTFEARCSVCDKLYTYSADQRTDNEVCSADCDAKQFMWVVVNSQTGQLAEDYCCTYYKTAEAQADAYNDGLPTEIYVVKQIKVIFG